MPAVDLELRPFQPGTTGWTAADLDDPKVEALWFAGRYEIVDGVLTTMPPAYFAGGRGLIELLFLLKLHLRETGDPSEIANEVDIVISEDRVAVSDAAMLTPADRERQAEAFQLSGREDPRRTRILIPPTLIIESVSPGHERHDLRTKRRWYAEFGVPHYWILDAFRRELLCLRLEGGVYVEDAKGERDAVVRPSLFAGLEIHLRDVWG